ncbi:hypothetical protein J2X46_000090 [Nocardioides sp. BE266]|uniref:DUF6226 family protein n=1 Tax=Nocardioides sp. BE266 TaxID=2817725 RepID=UPI00285B726B|nr:DUF6226 family protein [Nocardioides sp. BE266]MDR7251118.1 hypothetical protein [Nocardioides sp. BE266]
MVAVVDLDEAAARWRAAGLPAERGGRHPMGTENVLVRGPRPAYVELIAVGSDESNPWLDRIRAARGPISWAIAVDDMEAAREALVDAGFAPGPATPGSRRTPDGDMVQWVGCDLAAGPYDDALPFLIEWTTPMPPGPADGAVVESISLSPPDLDRVADLLLALGFVPSRHWPRRMFHQGDGTTVSLSPVGEPEELGRGAWVMFWPDGEDDDSVAPLVSIGVSLASGDRFEQVVLDGVAVSRHADRRRFPPAALLPAVDAAFARLRGDLADWPNPHPDGPSTLEEEYSRVTDAGRYRLLAVRSDAWIEAITSAGLGAAEQVDPVGVEWLGDQHLAPSRATIVRGRPGTQPLVVGLFADDTFVRVGVGEPTEVLELQPDCGCDACDTGSADLLDTIDSAFVLALSGGVYVVREGEGVVTRSLDGWGSRGVSDGERWLAEASAGRRTAGVVAGEPWL